MDQQNKASRKEQNCTKQREQREEQSGKNCGKTRGEDKKQ